MKTIFTLTLLCLFSYGFSQQQLIELGTVKKINAKAKATNSHPLLVVQNIVYAIPEDCFCNRDLNVDNSGRNKGDDDSGRNTGDDDSGRNKGKGESDRDKGDDQSGRDLGTDFIYRDVDDAGNGRDSGSDGSDRGLNKDNAGRNADTDNTNRNADTDANSRNAGNATGGRNAGLDRLGRGFATSHIPPSCNKIKDSCSIEIFGFHPKAKAEYFDKIESIKAIIVDGGMIIEF